MENEKEIIGCLQMNQSYTDTIYKHIVDSLDNQLESVITEGLNNKGFHFSSRGELVEFIKENCMVLTHGYDKTFTVSGEPFLLLVESEKFSMQHISNSIECSYLAYQFKFL